VRVDITRGEQVKWREKQEEGGSREEKSDIPNPTSDI